MVLKTRNELTITEQRRYYKKAFLYKSCFKIFQYESFESVCMQPLNHSVILRIQSFLAFSILFLQSLTFFNILKKVKCGFNLLKWNEVWLLSTIYGGWQQPHFTFLPRILFRKMFSRVSFGKSTLELSERYRRIKRKDRLFDIWNVCSAVIPYLVSLDWMEGEL